MKKDKKWYIATGAGLGMIFGYAIIACGNWIGFRGDNWFDNICIH